jgi:hypothetical protein
MRGWGEVRPASTRSGPAGFRAGGAVPKALSPRSRGSGDEPHLLGVQVTVYLGVGVRMTRARGMRSGRPLCAPHAPEASHERPRGHD